MALIGGIGERTNILRSFTFTSLFLALNPLAKQKPNNQNLKLPTITTSSTLIVYQIDIKCLQINRPEADLGFSRGSGEEGAYFQNFLNILSFLGRPK